MNTRFLAALGAGALLLSCQDSRSTSTEVENEITLARLVATAEDSSVVAGAFWTLTDSAGTTLGSGTTDSIGSVVGSFAWNSELRSALLEVSAPGGTIRSIFLLPDGFMPTDTLQGDANLLTESVADQLSGQFARGLSRETLRTVGDSVVRAVTGIPMRYESVSSTRGRRPPEADAMLGVLESQSRRSGLPPRAFVESLRLDPRRGVAQDTGFVADLALELRQLELSPDSQSLVAWRIDSLGGKGGQLVQDWSADRSREDSLLFASLLPWMADPSSSALRGDLLGRADQLGHDAAAPLPAPSNADDPARTIRRATIRLFVTILGDLLGAPTDSAGRAALDQILYPTRMVMLDSWKHMRQTGWLGRDSAAATFIGAALQRQRSPFWSTQVLVTTADPRGYTMSFWPMPPQKDLNSVLDSLAATGRWGLPADIVLSKSETSTGP